MKEFFKKYKILIIVLVVIIIMIIAGLSLYKLVAPDYKKSLYGDRLESIEKYKISAKRIDEIEESVKGLEYVKSFDYNLKGRIMNFVINVNDSTTLDDSKKVWNLISEKLEENETSYYDIQVFLIENDKSEIYPVIGYKHKTSDELVWSK